MRRIGWVALLSACGTYDTTGWAPASEDPVPMAIATDAPSCSDTPAPLFLSPDDSNSMSSAVQAREAVLGGRPLTGVPVRAWEFLNYYRFDYPAPTGGEDLAVSVDLARGEGDELRLQIGLASGPMPTVPVNVALVIDDSCSMGGDPIDTARAVGDAVLSSLRRGDRVSVVTWSTDQQVLLEDHEVTGAGDEAVLRVLDHLHAGGGTDLSAGLRTGYDLLRRHASPGRMSRLVLVSDGGANVGQTDETVIGDEAGAEDEDGVYLVGVGVGTPDTYNDLLMDTVTDVGKGASVFVPDAAEADRMFHDRWVSTMVAAARDVRVELRLPPGLELRRSSAEEVSTDPEAVRPQHVAAEDAVVLHQVLGATCGTPPDDAEIEVVVRWLDPVDFAERETTVTATVGELLAQDHALLEKGAAVLAYADALKAVRDQTASTEVEEAHAALGTAEASSPEDPDLAEIREVLGRL